MDHFVNLTRRFSDRTFEIRRLLRDDEDFRELCEDYEVATDALIYWRAVERCSDERTRDYQDLIAELESEIMRILGTIGVEATH